MCTSLLVLVALLLGASTASGANVTVLGNDVTVQAAPGEANDLRVIGAGEGAYTFRDAGATLEAGDGCTSVSPHEAVCRAEFIIGVTVRLGDGNDRVDGSEMCAIGDFCQLWTKGGPGADHLIGSPSLDSLEGDAGDDVVEGRGGAECSPRGGCWGDGLSGGAGDDVLLGGPGPDRLLGDPGADRLFGGSGRDDVSYRAHRVPLRVSLDGAANDGAAGEHDNVAADVEGVTGGHAADTLVGDARANLLAGGPGPDRVFGLGGPDGLVGEGGSDVLDGGAGDDWLFLDAGRDRARAGSGNDLILAEDRARDIVDGGPGRDRADVDPGVDHAVRIERFIESPFSVSGRAGR